jgi:hypothetical protein
MIYYHIKFHMHISSCSLLIAIKPKAEKETSLDPRNVVLPFANLILQMFHVFLRCNSVHEFRTPNELVVMSLPQLTLLYVVVVDCRK